MIVSYRIYIALLEKHKSQCKRVRNLTSQNDLYDIFYLIYSKNFYVDKGFVVGNHQFFA